jgi:hypothetical protein
LNGERWLEKCTHIVYVYAIAFCSIAVPARKRIVRTPDMFMGVMYVSWLCENKIDSLDTVPVYYFCTSSEGDDGEERIKPKCISASETKAHQLYINKKIGGKICATPE